MAGRPFICVKSSKDTRYSDHWIMTHGGGCVRCLPFHSLAEFKAHMSFRWRKIQVGAGRAVTRQGALGLGVAAAQHAASTGHLHEAAWGIGACVQKPSVLPLLPTQCTPAQPPVTPCPPPQVIAIDEAQFFPDLVEFCQEAVDNDGKHVIVAGLSGEGKGRGGCQGCVWEGREEACG